MNKLAQFDVARKTIYWMIAGIAISVLVVFFAFIVGSYSSKLAHLPPQLPAEYISLRFTQIPPCFAYQDPVTYRVYPNLVDATKFTKEQMDKCYLTEEEKGYQEINFQLELNGKTIATNNFFLNLPHWSWQRQVLLKQAEDIQPATLIITAQAGVYSKP